MTRSTRALVGALTCLLMGAGLLAAVAVPAQAVAPQVLLNSMGSRYVNTPITIVGYLSDTGNTPNKTVVLQRKLASGWTTVAKRYHRADGRFQLPAQTIRKAQTVLWRALVKRNGHLLDTSNRISVVVKKGSAPPPPPPGSPELLPNLVIKNLTRCSDAERAETGTCFRIREVDLGKGVLSHLLKFPVVTANAGQGPMEVHATRTSTSDLTWSARQIIQHEDGTTTTTGLPGAEFFFAGDGHSHWHFKDFDSYKLLGPNGETVEGEKHGYCLEDNTTLPGVTTDPFFTHDVVCGDGQPEALEITHGLSVGWGDTYPSSLPDQAIDITGLPDGDYTVKICADQLGLLRETNESDNCAQVGLTIAGLNVTPIPGTDTGF